MEHVEFQHHRFLVRRERLKFNGARKIGESFVSRDEECDSGAAFVSFEFLHDTGSGEHRSRDVEIVAVDQSFGDVEP